METRAPSWTPSALLDLTAGFADGAAFPDRLALGQTIRADDARGPFRNRLDDDDSSGDSKRLGAAAAVSLIVDDDTDISFKSTVARNETGKQRMRYITGARATPCFKTNYNTDAWDDSTSAVQTLQVNRRIDDVELTAITDWTHYERDFQMDVDSISPATLPVLYDHRDDALSQEVRLASAYPQARLKWLGGLHAYRQWTDIGYSIGTPRVVRDTKIDQVGVAGFCQVEYAVLDRLRLGVGARVEHVAQDGSQAHASAAKTTAYEADLDVTPFCLALPPPST